MLIKEREAKSTHKVNPDYVSALDEIGAPNLKYRQMKAIQVNVEK